MNMAELVNTKAKTKLPVMAPGDTVKVSLKVVEGDKERIQSYQGVIIRIRKGDAGGTFTVRRVAYGIGIERTFPMASPLIDKLQVIRHGKVRRAKLYYLRGLSTKKARIKEKRFAKGIPEELIATPEPEQEPAPAPVQEQAAPPAENKQTT